MLEFLEYGHVLVVLGCILLAALAVLVTRILVRAIFFPRASFARRFRLPWRFSLFSIGTLTVLMAAIFGWLRGSPVLALLAAGMVLVLWFALARFFELRRTLADRRNREFQKTLPEEKRGWG